MENEQEGNPRPIVVFYLGDLDPEGEDIERNFLAQADRWGISVKHWERLTVLPAQITPLGLVPNPGKATSSRAAGFVRKYGALFQIETEAVDPATLRSLVINAITSKAWFNKAKWNESKKQEETDTEALRQIASTI